MKKFLLSLSISILVLCLTLSFAQAMNDEHADFTLYIKTKLVHKIHYSDKPFELRSPQTSEEWISYHAIRIAEIHKRYCPGKEYNYTNPEEELENNFRFVFVDSSTLPSKVVGVIRVDLLPVQEAALRWVAIEGELQKQGRGTRMLALSERFIRDQGRTLIRVPAEEYSRAFYERLGYSPMDWPTGPHHPGEVSLGKWLNP